jgi:hypothetical protein
MRRSSSASRLAAERAGCRKTALPLWMYVATALPPALSIRARRSVIFSERLPPTLMPRRSAMYVAMVAGL